MIHDFFLLSILCLTIASVASLESKPAMVVEVFRHGARTLIHKGQDFFVFKETESLLPSGQRQHYNLGKLLAKKYPHLLDSMDPKDIYVRSSEPIRCTMSLQAQMFAIFEDKIPTLSETSPLDETMPPFEGEELLKMVEAETLKGLDALPNGFFPFAYETKSIYAEEMLHVAPWNCKYVEAEQNKRMNDKNADREVKGLLLKSLLKPMGSRIRANSIKRFAHLGENLFTLHLQGRDNEIPESMKYGTLLYNDTKFANEWFSTYYFVGEELERAIKIRNLMSQIIEFFKGVVNGSSTYKFAFLSGHETSYLSLLNFYNIYNEKCLLENYKAQRERKEPPYPDCVFPEYASQVIFELYTDKQDPYVVFLYNGKPFKICSKGAGPECKLTDFIEETEAMLLHITKQDVYEYCKNGTLSSSTDSRN